MLNLGIHINNGDKVLNVLRVMQICDSNFPIGSFNHSYGMETYLRDNKIKDRSTLKEWLIVFLKNVFIYNDGLAIRIVYESLRKFDFDRIWQLDREITVSSVAVETRNGGKLVASRMIELFLQLYDIELLKDYGEKIKNKEAFGHPAIVFAIVMYSLDFSEREGSVYHMYSTIYTLIQNAVRGIPLGQKDGQLLLKEISESFNDLYDKTKKLDYELFGACSPGIEISQINHEVLDFRLFMS